MTESRDPRAEDDDTPRADTPAEEPSPPDAPEPPPDADAGEAHARNDGPSVERPDRGAQDDGAPAEDAGTPAQDDDPTAESSGAGAQDGDPAAEGSGPAAEENDPASEGFDAAAQDGGLAAEDSGPAAQGGDSAAEGADPAALDGSAGPPSQTVEPDAAASAAPPADAPPEPGDAEATPPETALAETPEELIDTAPGERPAAPQESPVAPAAPAAHVSVLEVRELDWDAIRAAVANPIDGERAERILGRMEERLAGGGPLGLAYEEYAAGPRDQAVQVGEDWPVGEVWFVGDLHGDLLALEAALQHIDRSGGGADARIVFLGDLFDDGVHSAQVVLRVFELLLDGPMRITIVAGNHDEALAFADDRFQSTVLPSDFTDWLNAESRAGHPWAAWLGRLIIRFFRRTPRALFFPDGLLVAHGGIPHTDLHTELAEEGNWNDPRVLQDFVWLRAHPRARKRIPNRTTRGAEFGREDFAAFCALATRMGRPVGRLLRGHDHVEERFAVFPKWAAHPALTINTLSHRLPREMFGPYERVPVIARWVRGELPEVRRLFIPPELIQEIYPEPAGAEEPREGR